ncbi:MAG: response regulator [Nitrospiraceae bacterium]
MAKILVADDEWLICDLLRRILTPAHEVITATGGAEAVALFKQHRPQITVLDLVMPELDGSQVLQRIREIDPQASVIILTGKASDALEEEVRALGATDFLRKGGLSVQDLRGIVGRVQQQLERPPSAEGQPAKSILVVDDEPVIRAMLSKFLTEQGYRVRTAQEGPAALALAKQDPPHLVILDIYMPGMNGVEVFRQLRAQGYRGGVITLSASQDQRLLQQMLELGSADVVGKPVDLDRLALIVQVALVIS